MLGKDIREGMITGTRRIREIISRGPFVLYTYDYLVANDRTGHYEWYRQNPPPVGKIACNAKIPEPAPQAPEE